MVIVDMYLFLNIVEYLNEENQNKKYREVAANEKTLRKTRNKKKLLNQLRKILVLLQKKLL